MKAQIISIGNEILQGFTVDTNSNFLAYKLSELSFSVEKISAIADNKENICKTLDEAIGKCKLILITGGLGPTSDDITKQVLADYFGGKLVENQEVLDDIKNFASAKNLQLNEKNRLQAFVPDNCTIIRNSNGTAPAMIFEKQNTIIVSMPGVPFEMKELFEKKITPYIKEKIILPASIIKSVNLFGIAESVLAHKLENLEKNLPENIQIAYLPSPEGIKLKFTSFGENKEEIKVAVEKQIKIIKELIPEHIFGYDNDTLESVLAKILKSKSKTVSTAESCTGGLISHKITSLSGSSEYFKGGIISYSNEAKINLLGVDSQTIQKYGAVSSQTVEEMAKKAILKLKTDYSVAVSGIAGPLGATDNKPVGTTWIAVASKTNVISKEYRFGNLRDINIRRAAASALFQLIRFIKENN